VSIDWYRRGDDDRALRGLPDERRLDGTRGDHLSAARGPAGCLGCRPTGNHDDRRRRPVSNPARGAPTQSCGRVRAGWTRTSRKTDIRARVTAAGNQSAPYRCVTIARRSGRFVTASSRGEANVARPLRVVMSAPLGGEGPFMASRRSATPVGRSRPTADGHNDSEAVDQALRGDKRSVVS